MLRLCARCERMYEDMIPAHCVCGEPMQPTAPLVDDPFQTREIVSTVPAPLLPTPSLAGDVQTRPTSPYRDWVPSAPPPPPAELLQKAPHPQRLAQMWALLLALGVGLTLTASGRTPPTQATHTAPTVKTASLAPITTQPQSVITVKQQPTTPQVVRPLSVSDEHPQKGEKEHRHSHPPKGHHGKHTSSEGDDDEE